MIYGICAIIKNETKYLDEWINHHLDIGFKYIYLFEDYNSESHKEITDKYNNVILSNLKEENIENDCNAIHANRQFNLYSSQIKKLKGIIDWLAFIDVDEFIMLEDNITLNDLCTQYNDKQGIYLYWKIYNANNNIKYEDKPVIERFTKVSNNIPVKELGWCCKSIVNLNNNPSMDTIHHVNNGVTTLGLNASMIKCYNKAFINHYFTKSWEEWLSRFFVRGDVANNYRTIDEFFQYNNYLSTDEIYTYYNYYNIKVFNTLLKDKYNKIKNILLIGNKNEKHIVNSSDYDLIIRINRMNNFNTIKTDKTDLLILDLSNEHLYKQESYDKFAIPTAVLIFDKFIKSKLIKDLIKTDNIFYYTHKAININKYIKEANWNNTRPTTTIYVLMMLLDVFNNSNITITGIDVNDRSFLKGSCYHKNIIKYEEQFLQNLINDGTIKVL